MMSGKYSIRPILGRKSICAQNSTLMFKQNSSGDILTHCAAGSVNFDITEDYGTCTKSKGYTSWGSGTNVEPEEYFILDTDRLDVDSDKRLS